MRKDIKEFRPIASIHTLDIKTNIAPIYEDFPEHIRRCIRERDIREQNATGVYYIKINPNKYYTDTKRIKTLSETINIIQSIMNEIGVLDRWEFKRIDLRFDFLEKGSYKKNLKLIRYIMAAVGIENNMNNDYQSNHTYNTDYHSIMVNNQNGKGKGNITLEMQYYDRENYSKEHSDYNNDAVARFEVRIMNKYFKHDGNNRSAFNDQKQTAEIVQKAFTKKWIEPFKNSHIHLEQVQENYNSMLVRGYKDNYEALLHGQRLSPLNYIRVHTDSVFTKEQLRGLIEKLSPRSSVDSIPKDFITDSYYQKCIDKMVASAKRYLNH